MRGTACPTRHTMAHPQISRATLSLDGKDAHEPVDRRRKTPRK